MSSARPCPPGSTQDRMVALLQQMVKMMLPLRPPLRRPPLQIPLHLRYGWNPRGLHAACKF